MSRDSNLALIDYVRAISSPDCGIAIDAACTTKTGARPISGRPSGRQTGRASCCPGHTDVVPVDGQAWSSDPFRLERRDGNLYGRGTADMKGFIACCLAVAEKAVARTAEDADQPRLLL